MKLSELAQFLDTLLSPEQIKDYCPNGLQVQGKQDINKIVTGVTASQALIDKAIEVQADALIVHHGFFWKNESSVITGMKYKRIKALIENGISLFAYHLPLDIHPELGNNIQLAQRLGIKNITGLEKGNPQSISLRGEFESPLTAQALATMLDTCLNRECLHISSDQNQVIKTVDWGTGGGQDYIDLAAQQGIDAFISGEISERTTHIAREMNIHYFAAGHHATERYGVKALGEYLAQHLPLSVEFIDIDNPV